MSQCQDKVALLVEHVPLGKSKLRPLEVTALAIEQHLPRQTRKPLSLAGHDELYTVTSPEFRLRLSIPTAHPDSQLLEHATSLCIIREGALWFRGLTASGVAYEYETTIADYVFNEMLTIPPDQFTLVDEHGATWPEIQKNNTFTPLTPEQQQQQMIQQQIAMQQKLMASASNGVGVGFKTDKDGNISGIIASGYPGAPKFTSPGVHIKETTVAPIPPVPYVKVASGTMTPVPKTGDSDSGFFDTAAEILGGFFSGRKQKQQKHGQRMDKLVEDTKHEKGPPKSRLDRLLEEDFDEDADK